MSPAPLISVLVSTYASEKYLRACLADLEAQTIADQIEIIVIDSGSPENERAIVEEFQQRYTNVRYLRTERETLYAAWNRGVEMARGKYVTNANSDDSHRADALELLSGALEANPAADLSYGDYFTTNVPNDTFPACSAIRLNQHPPYHPATLQFYCVTGCHPMWRRTVFDKIGLFDPTFTAPGDYEFLLRFAAHRLRAVHIPQPISLFYQNEQGLSFKSRNRSEREFKTIQTKYRASIAIERLYRVNPADSHSVAAGWTALGNLAMSYEPPWFDNACQDYPFALHCYRNALRHDSKHAAARFNLVMTTALHEPAKVEHLLSQLPPEDLRQAQDAIRNGRLDLQPVMIPPAVEPLTFGGGAPSLEVVSSGSPAPLPCVDLPVRWLGSFFDQTENAAAARALVPALTGKLTLGLLDRSHYNESAGASLSPANRRMLRTAFNRYPFLRRGVTVSHGDATGFQVPADASYRIGWTHFPFATVPERWVMACNQMDEIWVPSSFNLEAFAASGVIRDKLIVMPEAVDESEFDPACHSPLPLPNRAAFNFLFNFDSSSHTGWDVLLAAYLREFNSDDDVCLYLRPEVPGNVGADASEAIWKHLRDHAASLQLGDKGWPRIELLDQRLPLSDLPRLYRAVDCLVAPSRAEGWGRARNEAMMMGLPVIATNWGSNPEFLSQESSYLLHYDLTKIDQVNLDQWHYRGLHWAAPQETHLRSLLRQAQQHPDAAREKGRRARAHMLQHFSRTPIANRIVDRLRAIERMLKVASCPPKVAAAPNQGDFLAPSHGSTAHVAWEGSFLDFGSLSHVNRELTRELKKVSALTVACVGKNILPPNLTACPAMQETARGLVASVPSQTKVTVRHGWPPSWERPAAGAWVLIQPWEFGSLPAEWVKHLGQVDQVWAPSEYVRRVYLESGVAPRKVKVVPNGIDPEQFKPCARPLRLATTKTFKFLFVGGTIHRKGPDVLLEAFLEAFTADDDVCLVIKDFGGDSIYAGQTFDAQIKSAQSRPSAPEILHLTDELAPDALPGLYTACDCLLHPYRGEGFSLPVLEAMACGLPVVVTSGGATDDFATDEFAYRLPALRKTFGDSISGMRLVKPGWMLEPDLPALTERLKWIIAHREEARAKGAAASNHVRRHWTWSRAAQIAEAQLRGLIAEQEAPPAPPRVANKEVALPSVARIGNLVEARELLRNRQFVAAWNNTLSALTLRPYHPEAYLLLAEISQAAGHRERARKLAEYARRLAPKWKLAQQFLKGINAQKQPGIELPALPDSLFKVNTASLTVCLITRNEERFLGTCLDSIRAWANQIIVVDTGSTDASREIAAQAGAEVYSFAWCDDFSAARNAALERATGDWVLFLDADEELMPEQGAKLRRMMADPAAIAFRLPMIDKGREEEGVSYVPRLFRNAPGLFYLGCVHEHNFLSVEARRQEWGLNNNLGDATLLHHGYTGEVTRSRDKNARNLKLLQKALNETPDDPNLLMNLGLELARAGRLADGIEQYEAAFRALSSVPPTEIAPEFCETLLTQLCTHLVNIKNFARLGQVLNSPLARGREMTATLHWLLGLACIDSKNFSEGAAHMRHCIAKRTKPAVSPVNKNILRGGPHHCLALCLVGLKQGEAARQAFDAALREDPFARPVRFDYAHFLADTGREVEALTALHELVEEDSSDVRAWQLGGHVSLRKPEFLEFACDWTAQAAQFHPGVAAIMAHRATALLLNGKAEESLQAWCRMEGDANPSHRAALIICETILDERPIHRPLRDQTLDQEFLVWYRRLIEFNASETIAQLNKRLDALSRVVPNAVEVLAAALSESNCEAPR